MDDNIVQSLTKIKTNIALVEKNQYVSDTIFEIEHDFLNLFELIKLFLISERNTYYGYFLMTLNIKPNFHINNIAGIRIDSFPLVFETNPLLLCKFTLKEIIFIICHEIDHIVFNHPTEMVRLNPNKEPETYKTINIAADAAVNDLLNVEINLYSKKYMKSPKGITTSDYIASKYRVPYIRHVENILYYYNLIKEKPSDESDNNGQQEMLSGLQSNQSPEEHQTQEQNKENVQDDFDNPSENQAKDKSEDASEDTSEDTSLDKPDVVTSLNSGQLIDHQWNVNDNDIQEIESIVREELNIVDSMLNSESRGLIAGHFFTQIQKINNPPILSWQSILKKYIGTINSEKKKTRQRLNRRQPERFDLSGTMDNKILKIVVAIDTSGSMSDESIAKILNEVFAIMAKRKNEVTVIECDAQIQSIYTVKKKTDIRQKAFGRGGTSFVPVIEYINENRKYRDALLIYFTDGFGDYEIPKPKTYRNLWVVLGNSEHLSLKEPYGTVVSMV